MFCSVACLFILSWLPSSQFFELKSVNNATIPLITIKDNVDVLVYDKLARNQSASIQLDFLYINNLEPIENIELKINEFITAVEVFDFAKIPSRSSKVYIVKDSRNSSTIFLHIMFSKIDYAKTGEYNLCLTINKNRLCKSSFIFSKPIVAKFTKPKLGLEGDPVRITCLFEVYPNESEIKWSFVQGTNLTTANITDITANDHIEIKAGKESKRANDTLVINKLLKNDSGVYMCTVFSFLGQDSALVKVNVKDRWAALYPFIGIVIEVIILVVAILAYEKYQIRSQNRKNKEYESANDDNKEPAIPLSMGGGDDDNTGGENGGPAVEIESDKMNSADIRQREAITKNV